MDLRPPSRECSDARSIACEPQRVGRAERCAVARAGRPPVSGGVDDGVPEPFVSLQLTSGNSFRLHSRLRVVGVGEILDPRDHGGCAQAVAGRAAGIVYRRCQFN